MSGGSSSQSLIPVQEGRNRVPCASWGPRHNGELSIWLTDPYSKNKVEEQMTPDLNSHMYMSKYMYARIQTCIYMHAEHTRRIETDKEDSINRWITTQTGNSTPPNPYTLYFCFSYYFIYVQSSHWLPPAPTSPLLGFQACIITSSFMWCWDQTQGFLHALCRLSHICNWELCVLENNCRPWERSIKESKRLLVSQFKCRQWQCVDVCIRVRVKEHVI